MCVGPAFLTTLYIIIIYYKIDIVIFSVSHLADGSLVLSLLIDSKTVSTRRATLSVLFC